MTTKNYIAEFKYDQREADLIARLEKYYADTEHMGNAEAAKHWREFKDWCAMRNYTRDEINFAKRSARQ